MSRSSPSSAGREYVTVDVFTDRPFAGNQLAVVLDTRGLSAEAMQAITREFNFSEVTFVSNAKKGAADVRIFTPASEVPFAGHPILGTAHVLLSRFGGDAITLNVGAGPIPVATVRMEDGRRQLWMKQPAPWFGRSLEKAPVADALSLQPSQIRDDWPILEVSTGFPSIYVPLRDLDALAKSRIDRAAHDRVIAPLTAKDFFVFAAESPGLWEARLFAPHFGIAEDPATGSSNGGFAAYLAERGALTKKAPQAVVHQGRFVKRPSTLHIRATPEGKSWRIDVGGSVVDVGRGTLTAA